MKKRRRKYLPDRIAGTVPSFFSKNIEQLTGDTKIAQSDAPLASRAATVAKIPLVAMADSELAFCLRQRFGFPWILELTLFRLRQNPLRGGDNGDGELLRLVLVLPRSDLAGLLDEFEKIADAFIPTLTDHTEAEWLQGYLIEPYNRFKTRK